MPVLGRHSITDIKTRDLLLLLAKGLTDITLRVQQHLNHILRYAVQMGYIEYNPAQELTGALKVPTSTHHPALELTGEQELVFPGDHNSMKAMSENTVNKALRTMGYDTKKEVCGHDFRRMACSALVESGLWSRDAVERQMSHQERNPVRKAYIHKARMMEERKLIMHWWADYLDANREVYLSVGIG